MALAISACGHHTDGVATAEPAKSLDAESLLVSIDDLRQITGVPDLGQGSELSAKPDQPGRRPNGYPVSCYGLSMMDVAFGQEWTQFKGFQFGVARRGRTGSGMQAVGIYPDDSTARAAFARLLANMQQCSASAWQPMQGSVVQSEDPSNFTMRDGEHYTLYRVREGVMIEVDTYQFPDNEQVARTIMRTISDRITNA